MAKVFLFNPYTGTPRRMDVCAVVLRCRCLGGYCCGDCSGGVQMDQVKDGGPVAWMIRSRTGLIRCCLTEEPDDELRALAEIDGDTITPLFAAPVAATPAPAPLTDAQLGFIWRQHCGGVPGYSTFTAMRAAIDAALAGQGKEASK